MNFKKMPGTIIMSLTMNMLNGYIKFKICFQKFHAHNDFWGHFDFSTPRSHKGIFMFSQNWLVCGDEMDANHFMKTGKKIYNFFDTLLI